ncbi:MAG: hypothetical protein QW170_01155 [Desulfurococcaceae archaeon]
MASSLASSLSFASSVKFRIMESSIVLSTLFLTIYIVLNGQGYFIACIMIPTIFLTAYLEFIFKTPWPRILLPYSFANSILLASRMLTIRRGLFIEPIIPRNAFTWFLVLYSICVFTLFHSLTRMYSVFLKERMSRYRTIIEGVLLDIGVFIVFSTIITAMLIYYGKIIPLYGALLVFMEITLPLVIRWFTRRYIIPGLLERRITFMGYTHPREPETEEFYFEVASIITLFVMIIPAVISYTRMELFARPFVAIALLGVYEVIIVVFYSLAYMICVHGALIESLLGDKIVYVENADVFRKWRDISWFLNLSLRYYLMMKYLSALYMLLQGLEILSFRTGDKSIYFGIIYENLNEGYNYLKTNKLASRFTFWNIIDKTIPLFNYDDIYVLEANVSELEDPAVREDAKRAMGSIVNLYCKLHELNSVDREEVRRALLNSVARLLKLDMKVKSRDKHVIAKLISKLENLMSKDVVKSEDLSDYVVKKPLTVNMFRNYVVHGQLYKNALVYRNNRVKADRFFSKPATLYTIYTLLLAYLVSKHSELVEGI